MNDLPQLFQVGALSAGGTWFAGKIMGPSADALGEQLKAYFSRRIGAIFARSEKKVEAAGVEPHSIAPGLLSRMITDASFSEEGDTITDWWANLFLDASVAESNRHAVFSDMMALLGPVEAECLNGFFKSFSFTSKDNYLAHSSKNLSSSVEVLLEGAASHWFGAFPTTEESLLQLQSNMTSGEVPWPVRPTTWSYPLLRSNGKVHPANAINPWFSANVISIGILERAGILETHKVTVTKGDFSGWIKAISITPIGLEFYRICVGKGDSPAFKERV